jgi:hypothetical protein
MRALAPRLSAQGGSLAKGDKVMRLRDQTAMIEAGYVYLPREAHWLDDYLHELTTFPNGKYDDQADSTSQALGWIRESSRQPHILRYYEEERQRLHSKAGAVMVKLKAPVGISHVSTLSGRQLAVRVDGTIEVSESDALPLLRGGFTRL